MKNFFYNLLEKALNRFVQLDPESSIKLAALNGRAIRINLKGLDLSFTLKFVSNSIQISQDKDEVSHTQISGTPLQLLAVKFQKNNRQQFFAEDVSIQGDVALGQAVVALFDELEIDWSEHVSRVIGDKPTHYLTQITNKFVNFTREIKEVLLQDTNEYLHEEACVAPSKEALKDFFEEVDELTMDADRLALQIQQLKKTVKDRE